MWVLYEDRLKNVNLSINLVLSSRSYPAGDTLCLVFAELVSDIQSYYHTYWYCGEVCNCVHIGKQLRLQVNPNM